MLFLILSRCRRHEQYLIDLTFKFFKTKRTVIQRRRQPKSIVHQRSLSGLISVVHTANLRNCLMRLVNHHNKIVREIINQSIGRLPRRKPRQMSGVVLDPGTKTCLSHHFYIKIRSLRNSLGFQKFIFTFEIFHLFFQFNLNIFNCFFHTLLRYNVMGCRKYCNMIQRIFNLSGKHVYLRNPVNLISEKFNSDSCIATVCRYNFYCISAHPECSPLEIHIISVILNIYQLA